MTGQTNAASGKTSILDVLDGVNGIATVTSSGFTNPVFNGDIVKTTYSGYSGGAFIANNANIGIRTSNYGLVDRSIYAIVPSGYRKLIFSAKTTPNGTNFITHDIKIAGESVPNDGQRRFFHKTLNVQPGDSVDLITTSTEGNNQTEILIGYLLFIK